MNNDANGIPLQAAPGSPAAANSKMSSKAGPVDGGYGTAAAAPPHSLFIRVTHWLNTCAFLALCISGVAILMAHPRLYWGESGGAGSPALMELPLPLDTDESGWGRSLHFFAAWVCLLTGTLYVLRGLQSRHFGAMRARYEAPQRGAYMAVIFVLFPLMIASGLAMSPAVNAALPFIVRLFGGQQSSRTLHFIVANLLVLFLALHVVMVYRSGFRKKMRGMVMGR